MMFLIVWMILGGITTGVIEAVQTWPNRNTVLNVQSLDPAVLFLAGLFWPITWSLGIAWATYRLTFSVVTSLEPRGLIIKLMEKTK